MPPDLNSLPPSRSMSSSPMQPRSVLPTAPSMSPYIHPHGTPSPRSSSVSLAAAATLNAADVSRRSSITAANRGSPQAERARERRRSTVAMNLNFNDPSLPGPGELSSSDHRASIGHSYMAVSPSSIGGSSTIATGDPNHHRRGSSLGEIHQELEQEQEAQVNRLLQMIRTQQLQLEQMRQYQHDHNSRPNSQATPTTGSTTGATPSSIANTSDQNNSNSTAIIDDSTPTSERSLSLHSSAHSQQPNTHPFPPLSIPQPRDPNHRSSRSGSGGGRSGSGHPSSTSPSLRPIPALNRQQSHNSTAHTLDSPTLHRPASPALELATANRRRNSSRDESAFYQAETANLTRENQMLRRRITELERLVAEMTGTGRENVPSVSSGLAVEAGDADK